MSIFRAMSGVADQFLGVGEDWQGEWPRYSSLSTLHRLSMAWPQFACGNVVDLLLAACQGLWIGCDENVRGQPSPQNWRRLRVPDCEPNNPSPEVQLERLLVQINDETWWNQVPVDSGILGSRGRRAIDLVHQSDDRYCLFELKVAADTPLSAAMQILQYGVAYLFYRRHITPLLRAAGQAPCMLDAARLDLVVLAPYPYYQQKHKDWLYALQCRIQNDLLNATATRSAGMPMSFRFECFPEGFEWAAPMANRPECHSAVLDALDKRTSPFCCHATVPSV